MRDIIKAFGLDLLGLFIYAGVLSMIVNPPLGLSPEHLMMLGLVFPLLSYAVTYRLFPEQFWKAFFGSVVFGAALLVVGFWLFVNMVI